MARLAFVVALMAALSLYAAAYVRLHKFSTGLHAQSQGHSVGAWSLYFSPRTVCSDILV
jgi:hypothetical protein